jgi:hypothetical protein
MEKGVEVVSEDGASGGQATNHDRGTKTVHEIEVPAVFGCWLLVVGQIGPVITGSSAWKQQALF